MSQSPLSDAQVQSLLDFVEPYVCSIQIIPNDDPVGRHLGTGWFFEHDGDPVIVTCEHVARWQAHGRLAFSCFVAEDDGAPGIEGIFCPDPHPVDAAVAVVKRAFGAISHRGQCASRSLLATSPPTRDELFCAFGFPGADAKAIFDVQVVKGTGVLLKEVELNAAVFSEVPPYPDSAFHICLGWSPAHASPMLGTWGPLSLPNGMSGSPLWNTRYQEITEQGGTWKPSDARIAGMIWGHSAKAGQLYATPVEALITNLLA